MWVFCFQGSKIIMFSTNREHVTKLKNNPWFPGLANGNMALPVKVNLQVRNEYSL